MRETRQSGSEGGALQTNTAFLPLWGLKSLKKPRLDSRFRGIHGSLFQLRNSLSKGRGTNKEIFLYYQDKCVKLGKGISYTISKKTTTV